MQTSTDHADRHRPCRPCRQAQTMQTGTDHADRHRPCRQAQTMQTMQTGTDHAWLPAVRVPSSCPLDPPTAWTVHMLDVRAED
eukprot:365910-Chlamydomonas_euryale.AAC.37